MLLSSLSLSFAPEATTNQDNVIQVSTLRRLLFMGRKRDRDYFLSQRVQGLWCTNVDLRAVRRMGTGMVICFWVRGTATGSGVTWAPLGHCHQVWEISACVHFGRLSASILESHPSLGFLSHFASDFPQHVSAPRCPIVELQDAPFHSSN